MASDFKDAFLKAGLVTKKEIDDKETQEKKSQLEQQKQLKEKQRQEEIEFASKFDSKMQSFDRLWSNIKSKNFMKHLLNAFLPFSKGQIVFDWTLISFQSKNCCICHRSLLSKIDVLEKSQEVSEHFLANLRKEFERSNPNLSSPTLLAKQQVFGDKLFGIFSQDSKCLFCGDCFQTFSDWISNKMMSDQSFLFYINSIRRNSANVIN
jgi:hypothetical protein